MRTPRTRARARVRYVFYAEISSYTRKTSVLARIRTRRSRVDVYIFVYAQTRAYGLRQMRQANVIIENTKTQYTTLERINIDAYVLLVFGTNARVFVLGLHAVPEMI